MASGGALPDSRRSPCSHAAFNGHLYGRVPWQDWLKVGSDGLYHTPVSRGWGTLNIQELVGRMLVHALVGLAVVSFLALFEEIGWRAWLLPRLRQRMNAGQAVVVTAVIWALWHIPFQLSGILHIDGVSPLKLVLALPIGTVAAGLILGWLWLRTESIWLVAIAHGALNDWGQYAFKYMRESIAPDKDWWCSVRDLSPCLLLERFCFGAMLLL